MFYIFFYKSLYHNLWCRSWTLYYICVNKDESLLGQYCCSFDIKIWLKLWREREFFSIKKNENRKLFFCAPGTTCEKPRLAWIQNQFCIHDTMNKDKLVIYNCIFIATDTCRKKVLRSLNPFVCWNDSSPHLHLF